MLSDSSILSHMASGDIKIEPFRKACLQPNSYDIHLGKTILVYEDEELDPRRELQTRTIEIPKEGLRVVPGILYLGVTEEYTETSAALVPMLDGKSSIGRLGMWVHVTAGRGDAGFKGHWTLEIAVVQPARIYAGMPIGQLHYMKIEGEVLKPYGKKGSKYQQQSALPVASKMHHNWNAFFNQWGPHDEEK